MSPQQWLALGIFIVTFGLIVSEKVHRLKAALMGFCGVLLLHLVTQEQVFDFIDFNTIGLLIGMMILVGIVKETGLIQLVAIKAITLSRGNPWHLLVALSLLTALISALLDNVTTVLLIGPVALAVCETLDIHPEPFIFAEIFSSNIGGTATLIGDPPNILIGSAANLSFNDFLFNLTPPVLLGLIIMYIMLFFMFRQDLKPRLDTPVVLEKFSAPRHSTLDKKLTYRTLGVLAGVLIAFTMHHHLGYEAATIALTGAAMGLLLCPIPVQKPLEEVDWITILFFSALFMLVGTLEHLGIIDIAAEKMVAIIGNRPKLLSMSLIWGSGIISAIVDNVPYTAAVIPLVRNVAHLSGMDPLPLWWSLALGACLGGNGTLVGASANLVMAGIAEKGGYKISFKAFLQRGVLLMIATLLSSSVYVYLRYFL
ncbi:MAG TPA: ArsB/NhaD family transporter [Synergistaceae bacterium]|nr:ArsB/NhaD family transporter [Synergistaceae bacterium]HPJ24922.1 ArsB/NhaD family transporter [Synergistaceae bacterium]HPQ37381.1 ArsB/NhaD family transporter [Synergistaceae bacterium]